MKMNPGIPGRFRRRLLFKDWSDSQLSDLVISRFEKGVPPGRPYDLEDTPSVRTALNKTFVELRKRAGHTFCNAREAVSLHKAIENSYLLRSGRLRAAQGHMPMMPPPITGAPLDSICCLLFLLTCFAVADVTEAAKQLFDSRMDSSLSLSFFNQHKEADLTFLKGAKFTGGSAPTTLEQLRSFQVIGLYFSASWCPPCKAFTPLLAQSYRELADMKFEIIFVSNDRDAASFQEYFGIMPWIAVSFNDSDKLREDLRKTFQVTGIPTLVLYNTETGAFTNRGVELVRASKLRDILQEAQTKTASAFLKTPGRGSAKTMEAPAQAGSVAHFFKSEEVADNSGQSMESAPDSNLDFLRDHMRKIEARLRDAQGGHRTQLEEELRRTQELVDKIKLLDEVKAQALIEEEKERLALMQQVVKRICELGRCPMDFAWRWEGDQFHCEGGSHFATPAQLGVTAEACSKFFSKTGVMEI